MPAPDRRPARDLALIAVFAGVIAALGLVPAVFVPGFPAPITLQSMGVVLAGAVLGGRRGFLSVLLFLALVALGLPLLSGGRGGLAVFTSPSAGFLFAFPIAALIVGWLTYRYGAPYKLRWGIPVNVIGGMVVLYLGGVVGLMTFGKLSLDAAFAALVIFIPGDLVKMVVAALVARGVHAALPDLLPPPRTADEPVDVAA
ncbi:MAG: biotin transporter BioY [Candidatus Nanopelagicales bacterium]